MLQWRPFLRIARSDIFDCVNFGPCRSWMGTIDPTVAKNQVKAQFVLTHSSFMWKSSPERINRVRHQLRYAFREVRLETRLIAEQTREVVEAAIELLVMRCKESLLIEIPTVKNVYRWQNFSRMK